MPHKRLGGLASCALILSLLTASYADPVRAAVRMPVDGDSAPTHGRTLVMLVYFSGDRPPDAVTAATTHELMFGGAESVREYYAENSYGRLMLTGDVSGWWEVPIPPGCNLDFVTRHAMNAVRTHAPSINFGSYDHVVTVATFSAGRCPDGQSTIGASAFMTPDGSIAASRALLRSTAVNFYTLAHELGHGLGLHHAGLRACAASPLDDDCPVWEYGDHFSVLGGAYDVPGGHFNLLQKARLGWIDDEDAPLVTRSGEYLLCPIERKGGCPIGLRLPGPAGGGLAVEFRQPIGFDAVLPDPAVFRGALIHLYDPLDARKTQLIDPTPPGYVRSNALEPGQALFDPNTGISVTALAVEDGRLRVRIGFRKGVDRFPVMDRGIE